MNYDFPVFPAILLIIAISFKLLSLRGIYNITLKDLLLSPTWDSKYRYTEFYKCFEIGGIILFPSINEAPSIIYFERLIIVYILYNSSFASN